jgi:hypothetical protein
LAGLHSAEKMDPECSFLGPHQTRFRHETTVALLTRDNDERTPTNEKICRKEMSVSSLAVIDVVPTNVLFVVIVQQ